MQPTTLVVTPLAPASGAPTARCGRSQALDDMGTSPHSFIGMLADVAAMVTALVALLALVLAWHQLRVTRLEGRLNLAKTLYREYLAMAIDNPKLSSASYPAASPRMYEFWDDVEMRERYEFYVAHLLFTAEEILALTRSPDWQGAMQLNLQYHALYLATDDARLDLYSEEVRTLARAAIRAYNEDRSSSHVAKQPVAAGRDP